MGDTALSHRTDKGERKIGEKLLKVTALSRRTDTGKRGREIGGRLLKAKLGKMYWGDMLQLQHFSGSHCPFTQDR